MCGGRISFLGPPGARRRAATSYATCLYECRNCATRYSNARDPERRTAFVARPTDNIPAEIGAGLLDVLDRAMNDSNRSNKREKFCAETSEDAITWTVFRWLHQSGYAALVPELCGSGLADSAPSLVLWGAPAGGAEAEPVRNRYVQVSDEFGEDPRRRTEIDVLVAWDDLLVAIEVKYLSRNDRKPGRAGRVARYVESGHFTADADAVDGLGFYELVRNWALGAALAEALGRRFLLVNLGPEDLRPDMELLRRQLSESPERRAAFLSWPDLVTGIVGTGAAPEWLTDYLRQRELSVPTALE